MEKGNVRERVRIEWRGRVHQLIRSEETEGKNALSSVSSASLSSASLK